MTWRLDSTLVAAGTVLGLAVCAAGCQETSRTAEPVADSAAPNTPAFKAGLHGVALDGQPVDLLADPGAKAIVLLFVRTDCPIANRFAPEINRLTEDFGARGARFWRVYPAADDTADAVQRHTQEFGLTPAVLLDAQQRLAGALGARVTPEAFVLRPDGRVVYRGRIDDRFVDYGKARSEPSRRDLAVALEETLAERDVSTPETKAVGCPLEAVP